MTAWTEYLALAIAIAIPVGGGFLGSLFNGSPDGEPCLLSIQVPLFPIVGQPALRAPTKRMGLRITSWTALQASAGVRLGSRLRCTLYFRLQYYRDLSQVPRLGVRRVSKSLGTIPLCTPSVRVCTVAFCFASRMMRTVGPFASHCPFLHLFD
jgi:hypothetical protein